MRKIKQLFLTLQLKTERIAQSSSLITTCGYEFRSTDLLGRIGLPNLYIRRH